jgi:hypothetical protein
MAKEKWIQESKKPKTKGALHRQLRIPLDKDIPRTLLRAIVKAEIGETVEGYKVTRLLKERANWALNVGKGKRKGKKKSGKWGKIGAPNSRKRKEFLKTIRRKARKTVRKAKKAVSEEFSEGFPL